jgi:hypothetical protein
MTRAAESFDADAVGYRAARLFAKMAERPCLPDLPQIQIPAAIVDPESAEAAREALAVADEHAKLLRAFLREGAEFRRQTGGRVPTREWDAAHDKIHDLARLRERVQEALGRYRRKRTSFERAFVEVATATLDPDTLASITASATELTRGER